MALVFPILNQYSGCQTLIIYSGRIFQITEANIQPKHGIIIIGVAQIFGNFCSTRLVDKLGRRFLLIVSISGCAFSHFTLVIYSFLESEGFDMSSFQWIPTVSLSLIVFMASLGLVSITLVCIAESLPSRVCLYLFSNLFISMQMKHYNVFLLVFCRYESLEYAFQWYLHAYLHSFR